MSNSLERTLLYIWNQLRHGHHDPVGLAAEERRAFLNERRQKNNGRFLFIDGDTLDADAERIKHPGNMMFGKCTGWEVLAHIPADLEDVSSRDSYLLRMPDGAIIEQAKGPLEYYFKARATVLLRPAATPQP